MAQFDVFENLSPHSKERVPYLLDVQHDLLHALKTRVVIPLLIADQPLTHLNPTIEVNGERYMLSTQEMAGVPLNVLGKKVSSAKPWRDEIVHAVDFLVTGF